METASNQVLESVIELRADIACIRVDVRTVKRRLTGLEVAVGNAKHDVGSLWFENANQHARHDQLAARTEKIEQRLHLQQI